MRFSFFYPTCVEALNQPVGFARPAEILDLAREVEDRGLYALWAADHLAPWADLIDPRAGPPNWYDIMIAMAGVASVTSTVKLALGVVVVPLRDPVVLAKQVATLDAFSEGRVLFGVGIGSARQEFGLLRPREAGANRGRMLDEALAAMQALFTEPSASFDGEYYAFRDLAFAPKPVQAPLPIYLSGAVEATLRRTARYGTGLMTGGHSPGAFAAWRERLRVEMEAAGREVSEIDLTFCPGVLLDDSHERAVSRFASSRMGRRYLKRTGLEPEQGAAENMVGTAQEVADRLHLFAEAGMTHCVPTHVGVDTYEEYLDQFRRYVDQVIPCYERD